MRALLIVMLLVSSAWAQAGQPDCNLCRVACEPGFAQQMKEIHFLRGENAELRQQLDAALSKHKPWEEKPKPTNEAAQQRSGDYWMAILGEIMKAGKAEREATFQQFQQQTYQWDMQRAAEAQAQALQGISRELQFQRGVRQNC